MPSTEALYHCDCSSTFPLSSVYYCQRCNNLRCNFCIHENIQSFFCSSCEQTIPSGVAYEMENRCKKCFSCPQCQNTLKMSTKIITSSTSGSSDTKKQSTHVFFQCSCCQWSSFDSLSAETTDGLYKAFEEKEEPTDAEMACKQLIEALKKEEHTNKMKERKNKRNSKFFIAKAQQTSRSSDTIKCLESFQEEKEKELTFMGKRKKAEWNQTEKSPLNDSDNSPSFASSSVASITTLEQRYAAFSLTNQKEKKNLLPIRKRLDHKIVKSCATCDKILVKPGMNPAQIQFDLRHVGWLFLPRFRLVPHIQSVPTAFVKDQASSILIQVQHRVQEFMYFKIENISDAVEVSLPPLDQYQYILPFEFDPDVDTELQEQLEVLEKGQTDPSWITQRKGNSLLLSIPFTPRAEVGHQITLSFKVHAKFLLRTGEQKTDFVVSFPLLNKLC